ncbi:DUF4446 family protein [Paenibacillus sp. P26]|nr:DUF4446 family protein [Paenibacillus sp. P26]UUZ91313.1 DUF4446 family protein [Paenibacillus sp. P25]
MGDVYTDIPVEVILAGIGVIALIFLILVITLWVKLNKLRKNYVRMMNGSSEQNVEGLLIELQERLNVQAQKEKEAEQQIVEIRKQMRSMKSNIGIHRYNAFAERGSDLSFSVAILDEEQNGVVLTGIHNREETYVYAKPVEQGNSKYTLSPEEKEAIIRCLRKS